MPRGEDTRNHPNRKVGSRLLAQALSVALPRLTPETKDDAPAGGIPRPPLHSCGSCGEMTSTEHGVCADCRAQGHY